MLNIIGKQSPDIAMGVDRKNPEEQGAGDQGLMFGYASNETDSLMPAPICYAHRLVERQAKVRKQRPAAVAASRREVAGHLRYENGKVVGLDAVVLSTQHDPDVKQTDLREAVMELVIKPVLPQDWITPGHQVPHQPDRQVRDRRSGRRLRPDGAQDHRRHATAAWRVTAAARSRARIRPRSTARPPMPRATSPRTSSRPASPTAARSRSPTRSASRSRPRSPCRRFGTGKIADDKIEKLVRAHFDLRPYGIVKMLDLVHPMYRATAAYGHFGRTPAQMTYSWKEIIGGKRVEKSETFTAFTWEKTDRAEALRSDA